MLNYSTCPANSGKSRLSVNKTGNAGKKNLILSALLLSMLFSYTIAAQEIGSLRGDYNFIIPDKIEKLVPDPLPAGTYSVGNGGYFPTIDSAFNKLSIDGIAGEIVLELIDNQYVAPLNETGFLLNGPIPGAGPTSRITVKPAENKDVTITGIGLVAVTLMNTSYLTIDGISKTGEATLTIHALKNPDFPFNDCVDFLNNSDHNIIQEVIFICEDFKGIGAGPAFWTTTGNTTTPDSNLIQNNFIPKAGIAIYVSSFNSTSIGSGNIIRGNLIGTETDSLINRGIQVEHCQNTVIENNIIQNIKAPRVIGENVVNIGINSYWGSGDIIRNNVVHDIRSDTGYISAGISLSGEGSWYGSNNQVYNNMVYDIQSFSTNSTSSVSGIYAVKQQNTKIYYNSVYLSGTGSNRYGSGALYLWSTCSNVDVKNNILVNIRDEGQYCAAAIYLNAIDTIINSDYNDLYYQPNNYNSLVNSYRGSYLSLEDWQATAQDLNSVTEMPNFISPYLHIDGNIATLLDNGATPVSGIDTDFDGDTRNGTTPDIGADEFTIVGVGDEITQPTGFALRQNYPNPFNPRTKICWQLPLGSWQTLKVYDILGNEIATLVDEYRPAGEYEIEFNIGRESFPVITSGVYFYKLQAGNFIQTKKMVLMK